jgi:hypothetical protein
MPSADEVLEPIVEMEGEGSTEDSNPGGYPDWD